MEKYLKDSARTAPTLNANNLHTELVPFDFVLDNLASLSVIAPSIDEAKKGLFYGKDTDGLKFTRGVLGNFDQERLKNVDRDLLHAGLGILTEAHEVGELLAKHLMYPDKATLDNLRDKLINESGDLLWYLALLFRRLGVTFEEVGDINTAKLLVRFPEDQGFTEDLAIHRDESAEDVAFQQS